MPWQDVKTMGRKILFISDYISGAGGSFSKPCRRYTISRKTGYKWASRHDWIFKAHQPSRSHMKRDVAAYMKHYNLDRLHSSNDDLPPIQHEKLAD